MAPATQEADEAEEAEEEDAEAEEDRAERLAAAQQRLAAAKKAKADADAAATAETVTMAREREAARREGRGGVEACLVPTWRLEDRRNELELLLTPQEETTDEPPASLDGKRCRVASRFGKEGMIVEFFAAGGQRYSLVAQTYAPVVPGWCKALDDPPTPTPTPTRSLTLDG